MKPIILLCGPPHSYSSMTMEYLLTHGAITGECLSIKTYNTYEDAFVAQWIQKYRNHTKRLRDYLEDLPADKTIVFKVGDLGLHVTCFLRATDRYTKVVMLLRNPRDLIISSLDKRGGSFTQHFIKYCANYDALLQLDVPFMPFITERLAYDGWKLLAFCELYRTQVIDVPYKPKQFNYNKYKVLNFIFKHFGRVL